MDYDNSSEFQQYTGIVFVSPPFSARTFHALLVSLKIYAIGVVSTFGVVSNTINIIIFYRQGITTNSSTVSLTALAISDLCCCFFNMWGVVLGVFESYVDTSQYRWKVVKFYIFTSVRPLDLLTQITCWVTTFTAFERLISVTFPFKVKVLFSPRRSFIAMICLFIGVFILYIPLNFEARPVWKTDPGSNHSYIGFDYIDEITPEMRSIFIILFPIFLKVGAIAIVVICNITILWKVNLSQKFRNAASSGKRYASTPSSAGGSTSKSRNPTGEDEKEHNSSGSKAKSSSVTSSKEMKLLRMITVISVVFVCCYILSVGYSICFMLILERGVDYHYYTMYILWLLVTLFQTSNSSTNIIIYYTMSSRYREEFVLFFSKRKTV